MAEATNPIGCYANVELVQLKCSNDGVLALLVGHRNALTGDHFFFRDMTLSTGQLNYYLTSLGQLPAPRRSLNLFLRYVDDLFLSKM